MISVELPLKLESTLNKREHYMARHRRHKAQRAAVNAALCDLVLIRSYDFVQTHRFGAVVLITRIGPRKLDGDNLQGSAKAVRDQIAKVLGIDDGDERLTWVYAQERRGKDYAVRIDIEPKESSDG